MLAAAFAALALAPHTVAWAPSQTIGFGAYLRGVADYGSIFGNLASLVILLTYLYLSAIVFLGGAQVDSLVRDDALRRD